MLLRYELKKYTIVKVLLLLSIFLLLEKVYLPKGVPTGTYNTYITPVLFCILFASFFLTKSKFTKQSLIFSFICILVILVNQLFFNGILKETLRYISMILIFLVAGQINLKNISFFFRILILVSFFFVITDINSLYSTRITGFLSTSPTLFSYILLISITYLIFKSNNKLDFFLILLGTWIIWETESRSTLLVALIFLAFSFINKIFKGNKFKLIRSLIYIMMGLVSVFLIYSVITGHLLTRDTGSASTETRLKFMMNILYIIKDDPKIAFFGGGSGLSYKIIAERTGFSTPAHFDPLTIWFDFGIFGLVLMFLLPLVLSKKWSWQGWILLFLGSIHNLVYFPVGFALAVICGRQIRQEE
jgi:O-Antigen ligase